MQTADYWIHHLKLDPHPEGGFYRETYRSKENIQLCGLPSISRTTKFFYRYLFSFA